MRISDWSSDVCSSDLFTTEWRAYIVNTWGTMNLRKQDLLAMGFTPEMAGHENDPDMQRINPKLTDGAYYGPSRGHMFPKYARRIGMPRGYGYGASKIGRANV